MGSLHAQEFANAVEDGTIKLDTALIYHLQTNHYPPLPLSLVPVAKQAIEAIEEGEPERLIDLPDGVSWKGESSAPAHECARAWHLDAFIHYEEEY